MFNNRLFTIFAGQSYTAKFAGGSALNLYRDFLNAPQLNPPVSEYRIGPDLDFNRNTFATYYGGDGILKTANINEPRFNYTPTGNLEGLLIEGQKTNLIEYSNDFSQGSVWLVPNNGVTFLTNVSSISAPDNTETATLMTNTSAFGFHLITWNGTPALDETEPLSSAEFYDRSIFIKKETARYVVFSVSPTVSATTAGGGGGDVFEGVTNIFDFDTEQFVHFSVPQTSITPIQNGWFRITFGRTTPNNATNRLTVGISKGPNFEDTIFSTEESDLSGVYIWGAQAEFGKTSTYIPTNGAQVTRAGDNASIIKNKLTLIYNPSASTFFIKGKRNTILEPSTFATFSNLANNNYWTITTSPTAFNIHTLTIDTLETGILSIETETINENTNYKLVASLRDNDIVLYQNNSLAGNITNSLIPQSTNFENKIDRFRLGRFGPTNYLNGHIQEFGYWPTRLTEQQILEL
jgi:hypothetical protein